jgi:hypothetical protein
MLAIVIDCSHLHLHIRLKEHLFRSPQWADVDYRVPLSVSGMASKKIAQFRTHYLTKERAFARYMVS